MSWFDSNLILIWFKWCLQFDPNLIQIWFLIWFEFDSNLILIWLKWWFQFESNLNQIWLLIWFEFGLNLIQIWFEFDSNVVFIFVSHFDLIWCIFLSDSQNVIPGPLCPYSSCVARCTACFKWEETKFGNLEIDSTNTWNLIQLIYLLERWVLFFYYSYYESNVSEITFKYQSNVNEII